ncbi:hypothetical protein KQUDLBSD_CDS0201 [Staphylococcus phage PG-2021_40]
MNINKVMIQLALDLDGDNIHVGNIVMRRGKESKIILDNAVSIRFVEDSEITEYNVELMGVNVFSSLNLASALRKVIDQYQMYKDNISHYNQYRNTI